MKEKECIFCKIIKKEVSCEFIGESRNFIAILDANPTAEGHTLIIPKKHYVTLFDIPLNMFKDMHKLIKKIASKILDEKLGDGFNILMNNLPSAGQVVMHAHVHLIPRKEGDGLKIIS